MKTLTNKFKNHDSLNNGGYIFWFGNGEYGYAVEPITEHENSNFYEAGYRGYVVTELDSEGGAVGQPEVFKTLSEVRKYLSGRYVTIIAAH